MQVLVSEYPCDVTSHAVLLLHEFKQNGLKSQGAMKTIIAFQYFLHALDLYEQKDM